MDIEFIKTGDIIPYTRNAKEHPDKQVTQIANSIREFGFQQPLVVDKDNNLIIGHGRLLASKRLGIDVVPCVRASGLSDEQIKALRLADNKLNESEWKFDFLNLELDDIVNIDMSEFGFDLNDITGDESQDIIEDDVPDVPEEPKAKVGDLYELGNHRLICGDSTDKCHK